MYACTHACMHVFMYVCRCMYACMYDVFMYICMYACMYVTLFGRVVLLLCALIASFGVEDLVVDALRCKDKDSQLVLNRQKTQPFV